MDLAGIGARLDLAGRRLAQRAGGPRGDEGADLVEFQQFQRVRVHVDSRPEALETGANRFTPW